MRKILLSSSVALATLLFTGCSAIKNINKPKTTYFYTSTTSFNEMSEKEKNEYLKIQNEYLSQKIEHRHKNQKDDRTYGYTPEEYHYPVSEGKFKKDLIRYMEFKSSSNPYLAATMGEYYLKRLSTNKGTIHYVDWNIPKDEINQKKEWDVTYTADLGRSKKFYTLACQKLKEYCINVTEIDKLIRSGGSLPDWTNIKRTLPFTKDYTKVSTKLPKEELQMHFDFEDDFLKITKIMNKHEVSKNAEDFFINEAK